MVNAQTVCRAMGSLALIAGCAYTPAETEKSRAEGLLRSSPDVLMADVQCGARVFASNDVCASLVFVDGSRMRFERVGASSFGASALTIVVSQVNGLVPRLASCEGIGSPNLHRSGPLGHHFRPPMADLKEAVARHREITREIQYWPECPQYWEVQDVFGKRYRYCARKAAATEEPPRPVCQ